MFVFEENFYLSRIGTKMADSFIDLSKFFGIKVDGSELQESQVSDVTQLSPMSTHLTEQWKWEASF